MKKNTSIYNGVEYMWSATQDSEHPDMTIYLPECEVYIQVEINSHDKEHNARFWKGEETFPISQWTATQVIKSLVDRGVDKTYCSSDIGLIFDENCSLMTN